MLAIPVVAPVIQVPGYHTRYLLVPGTWYESVVNLLFIDISIRPRRRAGSRACLVLHCSLQIRANTFGTWYLYLTPSLHRVMFTVPAPPLVW
jgi:hypothetical protein